MKNSKLKGFFANVTIETSNKDFINLNKELITKIKGGVVVYPMNLSCSIPNTGCNPED